MDLHRLSQKQCESIRDADRRIVIYEGAVRSGKSFSSYLKWIDLCMNGPKGPFIITGRTDRTIKRNIIVPLMELVGSAVKYNPGKGEMTIYNRLMYVVGANDERAEGKIRGSTFAAALVDEGTLLPEAFFKMLLSRLSVDGAQVVITTNPDSPFHWLKRDFIDREHELDLIDHHFCLDDNPSLSETYKENLKKEYKGLWYERYIEGKWVMAEGAVYDFFDSDIHVISQPPGNAQYYIVGIDYGTTNPCSFVLIGYNPNTYPNMWLEDEYYYDSVKECGQKADTEYAQDLVNFISGKNVTNIYIDPSAASLKQELRRIGVNNVRDAENEIVAGIRFQSQLLSNGTYKICASCTSSISEYGTYVWDAKASEKGIDKPVKAHDHSLDAQRYALYTHFFYSMGPAMTTDEVDMMERLWARKPYMSSS